MNQTHMKSSNNHLAGKLKHIFDYLMICVYICLGLYLLIKGWYALTKTQTIGIGTLLIVYSLFRIYRVFQDNGMTEDDEEQSDK
jgi:VanZ family protein